MVNPVILLVMILFAVFAFHTRLLRTTIISLAVISLLASLFYLRNAAPELAIAEAAIGSGLVALLFLASLKRNRLYTIAVLSNDNRDRLSDRYIQHIERSRALKRIYQFFVVREFEVQMVFVPDTLDSALQNPAYDLVIQEDDEGLVTYMDDENYIMLELEMMFQMQGAGNDLRFVRTNSQEASRSAENEGGH